MADRNKVNCPHGSTIAMPEGLCCTACGHLEPWPECPHGHVRASCPRCAVTSLAEHAPHMLEEIAKFGAAQLALIEALATCAHDGNRVGWSSSTTARFEWCAECGARRYEGHRWITPKLARGAKDLDRDVKASVLRGLRPLTDSEAENVFPIKPKG